MCDIDEQYMKYVICIHGHSGCVCDLKSSIALKCSTDLKVHSKNKEILDRVKSDTIGVLIC